MKTFQRTIKFRCPYVVTMMLDRRRMDKEQRAAGLRGSHVATTMRNGEGMA